MSDKIEVGAQTSGVGEVNQLVSAIDRLEASLAKLGGNNNALTRMAKQMADMTKVSKAGFDQLIELQVSMEERSAHMAKIADARRAQQAQDRLDREARAIAAAAERKLRQQIEHEQKQEASGNKFHYKQIEAADTAYARQLGDYVKFWEKIVATQVAAENTQKAIQQRRDIEMLAESQRVREAYVANWEKMLAQRQSVQERRDVEMHSMRQREYLDYVSLWDKLLAEQAAKQARQLEMERKQQYELAGIRAKAAAEQIAAADALFAQKTAALERQRSLNTNFLTSPLSGQIATAEKASVYGSLGGNSVEKYGSAAAAADIAALRAQHALLPGAVAGSTNAINGHNAAMNEAHALARGLAGSLGGLWLTYGSLVPLAAGAMLAGSLKAVVEQGREVEYQLKFVEALGGGQISLDKLLHITDQTVVSVKESAEGLRALAQNGMDASNSLRALPSILNLSVIGEMSVAQAALAATGAMSAFGLKVGDIDHVANVFAQTAATSNTSVLAMTESMKQGSTIASIYGVSLEQAAAVMGVLAKNNIIGGAAGTAYTNMLSGLFAPTEKAKKALEELGVTTDDGNGQLKDQTVLLDEINRALNQYNATARATFVADIWTVRGAKGANGVLTNLDEYKKKVKEAEDVTNYMGLAVSVLEDSTSGAFKRLSNSVSSSLDRAFVNSAPALQSLVTNMAHAAKDPGVVATLTNMADAVLRLTTFIFDHVTAIGIAGGAYLALRVAVAVLPAALTTASVAVGAFGLSIKAALGPVGWLIAAVGGLVLVYELFIAKTTDIEKNDKRIQNSIQGTIEYLDREIAAYKERNRLRDDPGGVKTIIGGVTEAEGNLHGKRALLARMDREISAPVSAGGPAASERLQAERRASSPAYLELVKQVADAERDLNTVREKGAELQGNLAKEETAKRRTSLIASMNDIIKMGATHHKGGPGDLNPAFLGNQNEALYAKTQELAKVKDQYEKFQISENEAIAKRNAIRDAASSMLKGRAPKEDKKGANQQLSADLQEAQLGLQLAKMDEQMALNSLKAQNKRGEIGDLQLINAELAQKLSIDQKAVDVAREQYRMADAADKVAKKQTYLGAEARAEKQKVLDTSAAAEATANLFSRMSQEELKYEAKTLADKGQYVDAYLKQYEADYALSDAKVSAELIASQGTVDEARWISYALMRAKMKKAGAADEHSKQLKEQFSAVLSELDVKIQELVNKSGPGAGLSAIFTHALAAEKDLAAAMPEMLRLQAEMQKKADSPEGSAKDKQAASEELKRIEGAAQRIRNVWLDVGKAIEKSLGDAFGKPGVALGQLISRSMQYYDKQKQIDSDLAKNSKGADPIKVAELQKKAAAESASAQISAYGDMAGAAKGFFNEQSGGYKALAAVEKAFRVAELAMTFESMAAKLFATTTVTTAKVTAVGIESGAAVAGVPVVAAAEAAKSSAYGITALAASLALPFPANLGAFAVVAGMLAAIGVAASSSGGGGSVPIHEQRQKEQGTGTVFGDSKAKSESIAKSLELVEKNTYQGLTISYDMLNSLRNIESSIGGLGNLLIRNGGLTGEMPAGSRGSAANFASSTLGQFLMGDVLGVTLDKTLGGWVGRVSGSIANSIFGGKVTSIDTGITTNTTTVGSAARGGLIASQYTDTKRDGGVFRSDKYRTSLDDLGAEANAQFGLVIGNMASGIKESAKLLGFGGESFDKVVDTFNVSLGKLSLKDMTGEEIQQALEAEFSKIGDQMAKWAIGGLEDFQRVGEGYLETLLRVATGYQTIDVVFQSIGKTFGLVGMSSNTARQRLIDLSGGLDEFASKSEFFLENFFSEGEQADALRKRIDPTLSKFGLSTLGDDATKKFRDFIVALDTTTQSGAEAYAALMNIAPAFKEIIDGVKEANSEAKGLQDQIDELSMTKVELLKKERDALEPANRALFDNLQLQKKVVEARDAVTDAYEAEVSEIKKSNDHLKNFSDGLRKFRDSLLLNNLSPLAPGDKYREASAQFEATLARARGGDIEAQDNLQSVARDFLEASRVTYASSSTYTSDFERVTKAVSSMADWADSRVDVGLSSLEQLRIQVGALVEIKAAVLSVPEALAALIAAKEAANNPGTTMPAPVSGFVTVAPIPVSGFVEGTGAASMQEMVAELKKIKEELAQAKAAINSQTGVLGEVILTSSSKSSERQAQAAEAAARKRSWNEENQVTAI